MAKKSHSEFAPKYEIGDKVRVIHGFMDVDYPDMPLGGWAGTVKDVQGSDTFTVRWSKETLKAIHQSYWRMDFVVWLLPIEWTSQIVPQRPMSEHT